MTAFFIQSDAGRLPLADASVDLTFTSPPYMDARTYGIDAHRGCQEWIDWMLGVVSECVRVTRGLVLVNCGGVTRDRCYWPGCEGLLYEWWKRGGHCWRPAFWNRVGIPGSGGKQWLRADVEYILAFKRDAEWLDWSDNTANGHPPKYAPGGSMSHRIPSGARVKQWGTRINFSARHGGRGADEKTHWTPKPSHREVRFPTRKNQDGIHGEKRVGAPRYEGVVLANPGNLVKVIVGGGVIGHPLAHENEAPFPQALAEWFIKGWCKPGGIVLDPFSGSGTTACAADALGRIGIGSDLRMSQAELGRRRYRNPHAKRSKPKKEKGEAMLFRMEAAA